MRKTLSLLLTVALVVAMVFAFTGCGGRKADYDNPIAAVMALRRGETITGKTVNVTATMNFTPLLGDSGMIYTDVNVAEAMQVSVCPDAASGSDVAQGDEVIFRIDSIDQHVPGNYYLNGKVI